MIIFFFYFTIFSEVFQYSLKKEKLTSFNVTSKISDPLMTKHLRSEIFIYYFAMTNRL